MEPIAEKYRDRILRMMGASKGQATVSDKNVYQVGNADVLHFIDSIVSENLLSGSRVDGLDSLFELLELAKAGEPCLLLLEHYSNFDLPAFHYLLRQEGERGRAIADALVAIAGIKLNETNPVVLAFTEAYTRLVIYPSRSIEIIKEKYKDPTKELIAELMRSAAINRAAMHELAGLKKRGKLVLVFPSGTRFRPWDPSTKKGVREIDSYIKSFSKMCLVAINGNILRFNSANGTMTDDLVCQDRVVYTAGPIIDCSDFREAVKREHGFRDDKKQAIVDEIMAQLERIHEAAEKNRLAD